jgi:hypothetical protein
MGDWLSYLRLRAQAKTGVNVPILATAIVAAWSGTAALLWISVTVFIWLADAYQSPLLASAILSLFYVALCLIAGAVVLIARNREKKRAEAALAAQKAALFDPSLLTIGLEVGRAIGWRRVVSVAGAVLLASGLAKEWLARQDDDPPPPEQN